MKELCSSVNEYSHANHFLQDDTIDHGKLGSSSMRLMDKFIHYSPSGNDRTIVDIWIAA